MRSALKKTLLSALLVTFPLFSLQKEDVSVKEEIQCPVVILGGGVGALTASLYLARAGINPVVIAGQLGGALSQSPLVQNWPGELEISGWDLIQKLKSQVEKNGAHLRSEEVIKVDFSKTPYTIITRDLENPDQLFSIRTQTCIIAMGSQPKLLGVPGEKEYWTQGVYNCAICDGALFKDQTVAVVGGGDSALLDAIYLSKLAEKVLVFVRGDAFRSLEEKRRQEVLNTPNIEVFYHTTVEAVLGEKNRVHAVSLKDSKTQKMWQVATSAVFLALGSKPNTELFENQLERDNQGYLIVKSGQQTSKEGIFAVGDIADPLYQQAISAAGDGAKAAIQAERYLTSRSSLINNKSSRVEIVPIETVQKKDVIEIISLQQFEEEMKDNTLPVCVDFYATWCAPCHQLNPRMEKFAHLVQGKIKVLKVNVEKNPYLSRKFNVTSMPTILFFNEERKIVERKIGTRDIFQFLQYLEKLETFPPSQKSAS